MKQFKQVSKYYGNSQAVKHMTHTAAKNSQSCLYLVAVSKLLAAVYTGGLYISCPLMEHITMLTTSQ